MSRKRYTACYTVEDGNWLVELAEIPQVHSFGSTLAKARANIRDALGLWLQADDPERIDIAERFLDLPADLVDVVTEANGSRTQARALLPARPGPHRASSTVPRSRVGDEHT